MPEPSDSPVVFQTVLGDMGASDITPATKRAVHEAYAAALDVDAKSIAVDVVENERGLAVLVTTVIASEYY